MRVSWCVSLLGAVFFQAASGQLTDLPLFQQKISTAFSGTGKAPASVMLSGSATWVAGSQHDSGTLQVQIAADGSMTETWSFPKVSRSFEQGPVGLNRSCVYTDASANQHTIVGPNCLQAVPWFFPSFVLQPGYTNSVVVNDVTAQTDSSHGLEKLVYTPSWAAPPGATKPVLDTLTRLQKATAVSISYDAQTALPSKLVFQQALDNDESRTIETSVQFSDYSVESGFMIPHRIKRSVQGSLQVDFIVSSVTIQ